MSLRWFDGPKVQQSTIISSYKLVVTYRWDTDTRSWENPPVCTCRRSCRARDHKGCICSRSSVLWNPGCSYTWNTTTQQVEDGFISQTHLLYWLSQQSALPWMKDHSNVVNSGPRMQCVIEFTCHEPRLIWIVSRNIARKITYFYNNGGKLTQYKDNMGLIEILSK